MDKTTHKSEKYLNLAIIILAIVAQFALLVMVQGNNRSVSREGLSKTDVVNHIKQSTEYKVRSYHSLDKRTNRLV